jgi:hypothetical protein
MKFVMWGSNVYLVAHPPHLRCLSERRSLLQWGVKTADCIPKVLQLYAPLNVIKKGAGIKINTTCAFVLVYIYINSFSWANYTLQTNIDGQVRL